MGRYYQLLVGVAEEPFYLVVALGGQAILEMMQTWLLAWNLHDQIPRTNVQSEIWTWTHEIWIWIPVSESLMTHIGGAAAEVRSGKGTT